MHILCGIVVQFSMKMVSNLIAVHKQPILQLRKASLMINTAFSIS